jgi:LacI family transcriptional regulator
MTAPSGKTLRDLAHLAKLSVSGVSYALRGHPSIPATTVARVQRLAAKIGYRADARVATLMAHIRRNQIPRDLEAIAYVWVSTPKESKFPPHHEAYLQTILAGAKRRAEELGCMLVEFWLDGPGMTPARLSQILQTRGITGVIFSPAMLDLAVRIDWPWGNFACAVIGNTEWNPVLHHTGHNHYRSMWRTLQRLRSEGCERTATILNPSIHDRIHGAHLAAFRVNHPSPALADQFVRFGQPEDYEKIPLWPRGLNPDALIVGWPVDHDAADFLRERFPRIKKMVTLDWRKSGPLAGMDIMNDEIAASAVDLVVAQLHRNERGVPANPLTQLLEGVWRENPTGPRAS